MTAKSRIAASSAASAADAAPALRRLRLRRGFAALLMAGIANLTFAVPAHAASMTNGPKMGGVKEDVPVSLAAEEVTHDRALNIVTARGDVELNQDGQTLYADTVSYNVNQDIVTASGNVSLVSPKGDVVFADYMQLTGKMKQGAMKNLLLVSAEKNRTAAAGVERRVGDRGQEVNELDHAVYSACDTCAGKENPLWQIKAVRIVHDEADKDIVYHDATIEMFGVPVAYTPYLSHADPTVQRRSGFLFPKIGSSSNLGPFYQQPYYWVTSPNSDVTLAPMYATDMPSIMIGEYRQTLADASFSVEGSGTTEESGRGNLKFKGEWDINSTWRGSADFNAVSSDTYLKRYKFLSPDYLTNRVAMENFEGDDYTRIEALSFRELRDISTSTKNPYALPRAEWTHFSEPGVKGGYWTTQLSTATLIRPNGSESSRISAESKWTLPYVAPDGEHYTLAASLRGDAYHVGDYVKDNGETYTGFTGRAIPEVSMKWNWPFASAGKYTTQVIEPVVIGALSPNGGNPDTIPNEDSRDLDFDDTDVLNTNRFLGHDRVETGPRATYGVNWNAYVNNTSSRFFTFVGQTVRAHADSVFPETSGIRKGLSDYVGRVGYAYDKYFTAAYRTRVDQETFDVVSNDISMSVGNDPLRLSVAYINLRNQRLPNFSDLEDIEQLSTAITAKLTKNWSTTVATNNQLSNNGGPLSFSSSVAYEDECFLIRLTGAKDYTSDRDSEAGWGVLLTISLKTIGDSNFSF